MFAQQGETLRRKIIVKLLHFPPQKRIVFEIIVQ